MKTCSTCKATRPLDDFARMAKAPDGLGYECKECRSAYRRANRERIRRTQSEWKKRNRDKVARYRRERRARDPERDRQNDAKWRSVNPEKVKLIRKKSKRARRSSVLNENANYRARRRGQFIEAVDRRVLWERDGGICGICSVPIEGDFHVDHIRPLSLGGEHSYANTQIAHPTCNLQKGNRIDEEVSGHRN